MKIKKRDGRLEQLSFDKIIYRLKKIKNDATLPNKENSNGKLSSIDTDLIAQKVILSIYDGVSSSELDEEAARIAISMTENPEYARLASRIIISNLHKNTTECFSDIMERLYCNVDKNGNPAPALADDFIEIVREHKDVLNETIDYKRDYLFDYFGFKTLEKSYLMKLNGKIVERPQHLYMRVAVQVHKHDIENVVKTYNLISQHYFTFASPTMFNAGSRLGNLSSCYLLGSHDSIEGIFKTMSDVAKISKVGGGIGIHINNIRSKGSVIRGTNGTSDGIIPMLKVYNSISTYVNQCFTPNTPVYTRDGIKRMDQVTTEDHLVTLDGSYKKVNEVIVNQKSEEILEIAVACGIEPLSCTKVHEIYALRSKSRTGKDRLIEQLRTGVKKASFMPAEKLTSNDYVGFPIPTFEQDHPDWTIEKCKAYGTSLIGCGSDVVFETPVLHLPKDKLAVVVAAMMDRCVKKQGGLLFTCESLNVIRSFRYMLLRFGILTSRGKKGNTSILKIPKIQALKDLGLFTRFEIPKIPKFKKATAPKTPNVINFFQFENMLYCRIKSINKKMYTGDVYDFNMIDNHNYLTDMGLVHNSGKRKGSFAIYLSPEHPDILEFLDLRKNQGSEDLRARDLFYAMWMPDLFMEQVEKDGDWYLMDPDECPGLADTYGEEYAELYWKYVEAKRFKRQIKAQDIWMRILESQIETGNPYILYKDQANLKSNQKNIGTIKSSNLCVAPETQILTSKGYFPISSLQDQSIEVWNGEEFSQTVVRKTGENQELVKVKFSNGSELECTKYHKFFVVTGKVDASELRPGMKIIDYILPDNSKVTDLYVTEIIHTSRISDTFCFTEPKRGMGIFNGVLTSQCAEVLLYSDHEEYAVCFTGDTQILTKEGYRRIDECDNKEVLSYFNNDIDLVHKEQFVKATLIDNGVRDVYKLNCTGVKSIKATENHLFMTLTKRKHLSKSKANTYEWKKLKDLTKNDKIILPKTKILPAFDNNIIKKVDEDFLTVGWMVGDGWQHKSHVNKITTYGVCFGPNEIYARDRVLKHLRKWVEMCPFTKYGHLTHKNDFYTDKNKVFNWSCSKQNFIKYIKEKFGLMEKTAHYKCIPDKIKKSSPVQIASFLSGLFSADGTVYIKLKESRNRFYVGLSSSSRILLDDVQNMLKCYGIECRIVFGKVSKRKNKQGKLTIENKESILNFNKYINFLLCKEKQQQLEAGIKTIKKIDIFRDYTKLKSIEYVGQERVYDLNVPETHNFIAEGFVVHNCNLMSVSLQKFVKYDERKKPYFDHQLFFDVIKHAVLPMNNIIDYNYYPTPETRKSNLLHRPIGMGSQSLSELFIKMRIPFESAEARRLNKEIFETYYFAALTGSMELAKRDGPYSTFKDSPLSQGKFQFDLWAEHNGIDLKDYLSNRWDWEALRQDIIQFGVRNSTLTTCMPTASSAQIMGNTESIEPFDSCIFKRRVLSGEYAVCNKHLVDDLIKLGLWNRELKDTIIAHNGSIQNIGSIPDNIKALYKTVWEMSMKNLIDLSAERGPFICMTQSLNLFMSAPTIKKLTSMHFYGWKRGLKTGIYYLRSKAQASAAKFSIDANLEKKVKEQQTDHDAQVPYRLASETVEVQATAEEILACSLENREACELCSS